MSRGSVPNGFSRRLLPVLVLVIVAAALVLAVATGHHAAVPHAASAIEYGL
jgi:hypothetical protein